MKVNTNFTKIFKEIHQEKWVALYENQAKVIDFDANLLRLRKRLGERRNNYVYTKVLRFDTEYCFSLAWQND